MWGRIVVTTVALVAASGEMYSDILKLFHFSANRRLCLVETRVLKMKIVGRAM